MASQPVDSSTVNHLWNIVFNLTITVPLPGFISFFCTNASYIHEMFIKLILTPWLYFILFWHTTLIVLACYCHVQVSVLQLQYLVREHTCSPSCHILTVLSVYLTSWIGCWRWRSSCCRPRSSCHCWFRSDQASGDGTHGCWRPFLCPCWPWFAHRWGTALLVSICRATYT